MLTAVGLALPVQDLVSMVFKMELKLELTAAAHVPPVQPVSTAFKMVLKQVLTVEVLAL